jgi:hypothetical protein
LGLKSLKIVIENYLCIIYKLVVMKLINNIGLAIICLSFGLTSCIYSDSEKVQLAQEGDKRFTTSVSWDDTLRALQPVEEGQKVEVVFGFTNTGKDPLIISDVQAACGCTVPEKPAEPIMPGKKGYIKAVFDSQGRVGPNYKTVTVSSNAYPDSKKELAFKVQVNRTAKEEVKG